MTETKQGELKILISIVVPVYNSQDTLKELVRRVQASTQELDGEVELILVSDGSQDSSWRIIETLAVETKIVKGIKFSRNFGQHKAIMAGLQATTGKWVIVMDADLQDVPETIIDLYETASNSSVDAVLALRTGISSTLANRWTSQFFHAVFSKATGLGTRAGTGNFGIYSNSLIKQVVEFQDQDFLFAALVESCKPSREYLALPRDARALGQSSYTFSRRFKLAATAFVWNGNGALKAALTGGLISAVFGIGLAVIFIFDRLSQSPAIPGWTSVIVSVLVSNGITLIALGTLGLYIGKIFDYTKGRPRFTIEKTTFR